MPIYLLSRDECDYDEFDAKVVRAATEDQARVLANEHTGDEGKIWTDAEAVKCELVEAEGDPGVIAESFRAS